MADRLKVLVLSDLFPTPTRPADGIFVERQAYHLRSYCDQAVVVPVRVFPPAHVLKRLLHPGQFATEWTTWRGDIRNTPTTSVVNSLPTRYVRYTSPPRRPFQSSWGFFAYPCLNSTLRELHAERKFDLIHAHWAVPSGVVATLAQRWMRVPIVLSVHGSDLHFVATETILGANVVGWALRRASLILANSSWTVNRIREYGVDPTKIKLVRLGGNRTEGTTRQPRTPRRAAVQLLSIGSLIESKGHRLVIEAVRVLREQGYALEYDIVGDGPIRSDLIDQVETSGLRNCVRFLGHKPHSEIWSCLEGCDIFVLPSSPEAFGVAYVEALSLGKSVIASAGQGGPEDLRALGDCIELVAHGDVGSLVSTIKRLIGDPERRAAMGAVGQAIVKRYYNWDQTAADTLKAYHEAIGHQRASA